MKLGFRMVLDEPSRIDEAWPLTLPNGAIFRVIVEEELVIAFEVEIAMDPGVMRKDDSAIFQTIRSIWTEMRQYFHRIKSYLQCASEVNFDPLEVEIEFLPENDNEKKRFGNARATIGRPEHEREKRDITFETLVGIAIETIGETTKNEDFIGELKNLSLRAAREGRYIDTFRYGFLLIDALFGKGQFKTKNLQGALKNDPEFSTMVAEARIVEKERIEDARETIERLICGDFPDDQIIDHLVAKRGEYFHGRKGVRRDGVRSEEEGKILGRFVGEITDLICEKELAKVLTEECWKFYREAAEISGNVRKIRYEATIIDRSEDIRVTSIHECEMPGSLNNKWNRLMWAYDALISLNASDETHEVETIAGRDVDSGMTVFLVELATAETMSFEDWKPNRKEGSDLLSLGDIVGHYDGGRGKLELELRVQTNGDIGSPSNALVQKAAAMAVFGMNKHGRSGLYMVQGVERRSKAQLFRITLDEERSE